MGKLNITTEQGKALFTQEVTDRYKEMIQPTGFGRSFFPTKAHASLFVSIEVQRGTEKIASDVIRGGIGNRNKMSRATEKIFKPPLYQEYFDAMELDVYDLDLSPSQFLGFTSSVAEGQATLKNKIERAYELQAWQVLLDGVVTLKNGIDIDFKRKVASKADIGGANYWDQANTDPYKDLEDAGTFLRTIGKAQGGSYNVIMGATAYNAFLNNQKVTTRADIRNFHLDEALAPQRQASGGVPQYKTSAGAYNFNIWTYPEYYEDENAVLQKYMADDSIVVLPEQPRFRLAFGAVPQLTTNGKSVRTGDFVFDDYIDERRKSHEFEVMSAGIAIPTSVDQIYTAKVV